jgi:hypothetical protein
MLAMAFRKVSRTSPTFPPRAISALAIVMRGGV